MMKMYKMNLIMVKSIYKLNNYIHKTFALFIVLTLLGNYFFPIEKFRS